MTDVFPLVYKLYTFNISLSCWLQRQKPIKCCTLLPVWPHLSFYTSYSVYRWETLSKPGVCSSVCLQVEFLLTFHVMSNLFNIKTYYSICLLSSIWIHKNKHRYEDNRKRIIKLNSLCEMCTFYTAKQDCAKHLWNQFQYKETKCGPQIMKFKDAECSDYGIHHRC